MKDKKIIIILIAFLCAFHSYAQYSKDSISIVNAQWEISSIEEGVVHKRCLFKNLYGAEQYINFIEIDMKKNYKTKIIVTEPNEITSKTAEANNAIAAINGSYYNEKTGEPACYYRIDKNVINTTYDSELFRVTGAMVIKKGKVKLIPWNKDIEKKYNDNKGIVLASGPLMIYKNSICDVSELPNQSFYVTKHPRSAIGITHDKKMLLLTVDGRLPEYATGMSINELAHLMKLLGCEYALNLDGGRSTTLWSSKEKGNGVLNSPAANKKFDQFGERLNANTIIITK